MIEAVENTAGKSNPAFCPWCKQEGRETQSGLSATEHSDKICKQHRAAMFHPVEVQIRCMITRSENLKNVLVEMEAPCPGLMVWLPVSVCQFGVSEHAKAEYEHRVVRIPQWLYKRIFSEHEAKSG